MNEVVEISPADKILCKKMKALTDKIRKTKEKFKSDMEKHQKEKIKLQKQCEHSVGWMAFISYDRCPICGAEKEGSFNAKT